jgi:putative sterol carrier protein
MHRFPSEGWTEAYKNAINRIDPIKGMMEGKLKLTKGHLPTIIRFIESSRQLVMSASRVPTEFAD